MKYVSFFYRCRYLIKSVLQDGDPQYCGDYQCPQDACKRLNDNTMYIYREVSRSGPRLETRLSKVTGKHFHQVVDERLLYRWQDVTYKALQRYPPRTSPGYFHQGVYNSPSKRLHVEEVRPRRQLEG